MVVGDIISATSSGTTLSFQPASGVEVMITFVSGNQGTGNSASGSQCGLTDGTNTCYINNSAGTNYAHYHSHGYNNGGNQRIPVTNTNYLTISNNSFNAGYAGLQIK